MEGKVTTFEIYAIASMIYQSSRIFPYAHCLYTIQFLLLLIVVNPYLQSKIGMRRLISRK